MRVSLRVTGGYAATLRRPETVIDAEALPPAERGRLYGEFQKLAFDEVANGFLAELQFATLYRSNIKNLVKTGIGLNETLDDVWVEK